jgi:hypothetical protein
LNILPSYTRLRHCLTEIPFLAAPVRLLNLERKRLLWLRQAAILDSIVDMDEFAAYVHKVQPQEFMRYQAMSVEKRKQFMAVVRQLQIQLNGSAILDVGPGYGDSLDICHEQGARVIDFVEIDPFFFTYNRLKRLGRAFRLNLLTHLHCLERGKYDLIWMRGCPQPHYFDRNIFLTVHKWLAQIERLASASCQIILCPHWRDQDGKRDVEDALHNSFTDAMISHGYNVVRVEGHNTEPNYPVTFVRDIRPIEIPQHVVREPKRV